MTMLKTSKHILASNGGRQSFWTSAAVNPLPSSPGTGRRRPLHIASSYGIRQPFPTSITSTRTSQIRKAHLSFPDTSQHHSELPWPKTKSHNAIPTPYEIFGQLPSAPYSKRRFYELVKLYHPDAHTHKSQSSMPKSRISESTRLYRYRLIIEANAILCCPDKRRAYDSCGAGWHGMPDMESIYRQRRDKPSPHDASRCATWEDWEAFWEDQRWWRNNPNEAGASKAWAWHNGPFTSFSNQATGSGSWFASRHRGRSQRPVYVSNGSFVVLVVIFTVVGAAHEMGRAGRLHKSFLEQLEAKHDVTSKELIKSRRESREWETNDARVKNFLRMRKEDRVFIDDIHVKEGRTNPHISKELDVSA